MQTNDLTLLICLLAAITLLTLLLLGLVLWILVKTLLNLHYSQETENQRLRNQILTMGDLSALERLNRATVEPREKLHTSASENSKAIDPQDIITTPSGPVVEIDGQQVPISALMDDALLAQGWADNGDVDYTVNPEGTYVPGRNG